jgi:diacylglycerol kinase (ATP)
MSTRIIINPTAGAGQAKARMAKIRSLLTAAFPTAEWVESRNPQHLTELATQAAQLHFEQVIVAGGDGTIHLIANSLVGTSTALGIVPVGTGNDIATSVGLPKDLEAVVNRLATKRIRHLDVGQVGNRIFCCVLGIGLDTPALQFINASKWRRSNLLYNWSVLRTLMSYQPRHLTLKCGDLHFSGDILFAAVTNTRTYAGGIPITPSAQVDDGLLNICIIPAMRLPQAIFTFTRVKAGSHVKMSNILTAQGTTVQLESTQPLPITLDGELTSLTTPITVNILPGALRVLY